MDLVFGSTGERCNSHPGHLTKPMVLCSYLALGLAISRLTKDIFRLLSQFYSEDCKFQGKFPGPARRHKVALSRTLSWTIFWVGVLTPFLATKYGRSIYLKSWFVGSIGTVLYMTILYDKLQR